MLHKKEVAVIQFPGSNCEYETKVAVEKVGLSADIVSWNTSEELLSLYYAYILPGGFSFQDRVRAGVVSSKLPVLDCIKKQADLGKPILGICNGCQILAESGLVPNIDDDGVCEMALAPNIKNDAMKGFICDWVYVTISNPEKSVFTQCFNEEDVLPIPINHGEGNVKFLGDFNRFKDSISYITYCKQDGSLSVDLDENPNGSSFSVAGLSNKKGNVLAMMPHPERATFWHQIPRYLNNSYSDSRRNLDLKNGPWLKLFESLKRSIRGSN